MQSLDARSNRFVLALAFTVMAAACGGGSSAGGGSDADGGGGGGGGTLTTGMYAVSGVTNRQDACALLPTNDALNALGLPVTVSGANISTEVGFLSNWPYTTPSLSGMVSGNDFSLALSDLWDLTMTPFMMLPPYDCTVRINRGLTGTITSDNHAGATLTATATVVSGAQCADAVAWLAGNGVPGFAFPCSSSVRFDLARTGDIPLPPVTRVTSLTAEGAVLTDSGNKSPVLGTGSVTGLFEDAAIDGTGQTACFHDGTTDQYWLTWFDTDYQVQASVAATQWAATGLSIDGTNITVSIYRMSDGSRAEATGGTLTLTTAPFVLDDGASVCNFALSDVTFP